MKHNCKNCVREHFCEKAQHIENYRIDDCREFKKNNWLNRLILKLWRKKNETGV
jgi:hypothetical protein